MRSLVSTCISLMECPKCGSYGTEIEEGPFIYDDCMKFKQTCYDCDHKWTGVYDLPERIGVEDEYEEEDE